MSSPFSFFRKYAKEMTVALIGLSMFAFIVLDMLRPEQLPMVLLALVGATIFFFLSAGATTNRRVIYTVVGLIAGWVLGTQFVGVGGSTAPVTVNGKEIQREELEKMIYDRNLANQFLIRIQQEAMGEQALQMRGGPVTFGFGQPLQEDVVLGSVLNHIGDDLKVAVTDDVIADFISEITQSKVTRQIFADTLERMKVPGSTVYDAIRTELKASLAYKLHQRHLNATPSDYWDTFRKTRVRQELQVIAFEIDKFEPLVQKEPTDSEITAYFERFKESLPGEFAPGSPGFREPRKMNVEFLLADREALQAELSSGIEITDEEVEKFYEENQETYRNINPFPSMSEEEADAAPSEPAAAEKPESTESAPAEEKPAEEKPAEETPAEEKPAEEAPAEPQSALPNSTAAAFASVQDETTPAEEPAAEEKPAEEAEPAAEEKPAEESTEPAEPAAEGEATEPAAEGEAAEPKPDYRPLDEELKTEIREQLLNRRINSMIYDKMEVAMKKMQELSETYRVKSLEIENKLRSENESITNEKIAEQLKAQLKPVRAEITESLKNLATESGLVYKSTGLINVLQLAATEESEEYNPDFAIGNSTPAASPDNPFSASSTPVWYTLFRETRPEEKYYPAHTSGSGFDNNQYCYWKTEDIPSHIPELDADIRKEVVKAMITDLAKPMAQKRAEEVAEIIRKNEGKLAESIADQTITGQNGSEVLSFFNVDPFSWMIEVSTRGQQSFAPQTQIEMNTQIDGLDSVGNTFMETTFDEMEVGEVRVVPNRGPSVYYIVKVISREPSTEEELNVEYASFVDSLKRSLPLAPILGPSPYARPIMEDNREVMQAYLEKIKEAYQVKWNVNL
ncbi:MAG: hypothetical protein R3C11_17190 [Planctomycetaceae bacterium]